ncbi:hypothetical protein Lfu02_62860 [Longispora fulva]|uniref:GNAT superfamily N-acetyltransferase n=1 Tax=Longispora fulva TaxID=619741 RepID=A0A8J7G7V7_9ACTN|nr:hypothetical protein [Longispora fulva]MBG6134705.1 GNAT superfamily N-acetyltransferase [Longispora fulva]GIG61914.1 hypothetical protein Lfu02_62860 [Longispora fulva]
MRRDWQGPADLRELQLFGQRIWSPASRLHLGDLAWGYGMAPGPRPEAPMALWESGGETVAWGGLHLPGELSLLVDPARPEFTAEVLDWAGSLATGPLTVTVLDAERHLIDVLTGRGFVPADLDGPFFLALSRSLADLPPVPALPDGFVVRPVRGERDVDRRVAVHAEVWAPSALTADRWRTLTAGWPYSAEFDLVVEAPDGRFVAYCMGWYDAVNRSGEFEPVGTVPGYRRRGLSRAVGLAVLHAFRAAGGETALVYPRGDDGYPVPRRVYGDLGFTPHARTVRYRRP